MIVCDAVPRVVPWNAAKADGVREKRLARAKYLSPVHWTGVSPSTSPSPDAMRPRCNSSSAMTRPSIFGSSITGG